jgi:hypothetical protein
VNDPEDEIPKRFINGCDGDLKEARRRWEITREWRQNQNLDSIHEEEQKNFNVIKDHYPFYWCGRGKEVFYLINCVKQIPRHLLVTHFIVHLISICRKGHIIFYERPGELDREVLINQTGLTCAEMIRHYLFVTEYQWKYLAPDEMAKSISVVDMGSVTMASLTGEPFKFLNESIKIANAHYPERSYVIFIVNAPGWFSWLWKMIKVLKNNLVVLTPCLS